MTAPAMVVDDTLLLDLESTCLLSAIEGKPRRPLLKVAEELLTDFRPIHSGEQPIEEPDGTPSNLIYFYNMGSLVQYHCGELQRAEDVCRHAIAFCRHMAEMNRSAYWSGEMLQPYINIGRIEAARGNTVASLKIFDSLYRYVIEGDDLVIDGQTLPARIVPELIKRETKLMDLATTVYLTDSIRAYLFAEDYASLSAFLDRLADSPRYADSFFERRTLEARIRSLFALNKSREALETLAGFLRTQTGERWRDVALYCLVSYIYTACGKPNEADKVLVLIERCINFIIKLPSHSAATAHLIYYAGLTAYQAGNYELAAQFTHSALIINRDLGHEVGELKALCLLLRIGRQNPDSDTAGTPEERYRDLYAIAHNTFYRLEKALAYYELGTYTSGADHLNASREERAQLLLRSARLVRGSQMQPPVRRNLLAALNGSGDGPAQSQCDVDQIGHHPLIDDLYSRLIEFADEFNAKAP